MRRTPRALLFAAFSLFVAMGPPGVAFAQASGASNDEAMRRFDAGRELVRARRYAEAIPEFLASMEKERTVGALLNVADCYERVGKYASAWARFREASVLAASRGDDRHKVATAAALDLEHKLPSLSVRVLPPESTLESLKILVDGEPLARDAWNRAIPIDPGEHFVLATAAPNRKLEARVVVTKKGDDFLVRFVDDEAPSPSPTDSRAGMQRTLGVVATATGGALLVASGVAGLLSINTRQEIRDRCPDYPACTITSADDRTTLDALNARGQREAMLATIGLVAGSVLAVGGVVLIVSSSRVGNRAGAMVSLERHF